MPYTVKMYAHAPNKMATALFNFTGASNIKVALVSTSTPSQANDILFSTIQAANTETTGAGYAIGGKAITTPTAVTTALVTSLGADNTSWTSATFSAAVAVVYDVTTSALLGYVDFGGTQSVVAGTFTIAWSGGIIATITCS